nr:PKD domain-containing protein [Acanthopleuribacter pedis]
MGERLVLEGYVPRPDGEPEGFYEFGWRVGDFRVGHGDVFDFIGESPGEQLIPRAAPYDVVFTVNYLDADGVRIYRNADEVRKITVSNRPRVSIDSPPYNNGATLIIEPGTRVNFQSTVTDLDYDPGSPLDDDPDDTTYSWIITGRNGPSVFSILPDPGERSVNFFGEYTLTLEVEDAWGLAGVADDPVDNPSTREIIVSHAPEGVLDTSRGPGPVIYINEGEGLDLIAGGSSDLDNSVIADTDPLTFNWTFDGPIAIDPIVTDAPGDPFRDFVFPGPGTYTVTLTVVDSLDVPDPTPETVTVVVNDRPDATILEPTESQLIQPGESVVFVGDVVDSDAMSLDYEWHFDGGAATNSSQNPGPVTFNSSGAFDVTFRATDDRGAESAPDSVRVTVSTPPDAVITFPVEAAVVEVGTTVNFTANGIDPDPGAALVYDWVIVGPDVNETSDAPNPRVFFPRSGTVTATLTTTDEYGAVDATPAQVTFFVNSAPNGVISEPAGDVLLGTGETIDFVGAGQDPDPSATFSFAWDLPGGDPGSSTAQNPAAVAYNTNGGYTATLTVRDNFDTVDPTPEQRSIRVSDRPESSITEPVEEIIAVRSGSSLTFRGVATDTDDGGSVTLSWDFGDAANSLEGTEVTPNFGTSGEYTVTLRATDGYGLGDLTPPTRTLRVSDAPEGSIVQPTRGPEIAVALGESLTFAGAFTDADNNGPHLYQWDLGVHRGVRNTQDPFEFLFETAASGPVTFTVTDGWGIVDTEPATLMVHATNRPNGIILTPAEPQVTIVTGESVDFSARATDPDGTTEFSYEWDFNGGATTNVDQSPGPVSFVRPGVFAVTFTSFDNFGIADDTPDAVTVRVTDRPEGSILEPEGNQVIGIGESVVFRGQGVDPDSDISVGEIGYTWDFGEVAGDSNLENPGPVAFNQLGVFPVSLTVRDGWGVHDNTPASVTVTVGRRPDGTITEPATPQVVLNPGENLTFTGSVSDPDDSAPYHYDWRFGEDDQSFATATTDPITFPEPGRFPVSLTVRDAMPLADLSPATMEVVVNDPPEGIINRAGLADLVDHHGELIAEPGDVLTLQAEASDPNTLSGLPANTTFSYQWRLQTPGGVTEPMGADLGRLDLEVPGDYVIILTVTDDRGQEDREPDEIRFRVNADPNVAITVPDLDVIINPGDSLAFVGVVNDPDGDNPVMPNWHFGIDDLPDSSELEPEAVQFTEPGVVTVTFSAADALGFVSREPAQRVITVNDPPAITLFHLDGVEPEELVAVPEGAMVDFSATVADTNPASGLPAQDPATLQLLWDFGVLPNDTTNAPSRTFVERGIYPITFSVTDSFGGESRRDVTVVSTAPPVAELVLPDQDAPTVNLGEGLVFDADGSDPDLPPGESLSFVWDFDGEQVCETPPCEEPGDIIRAQSPGLVLFEDDVDVPRLERLVTLNVIDNWGLPNLEEIVIPVHVNRPPIFLQLAVYTPPGVINWRSNRAFVRDRDDADRNRHEHGLPSQPAEGALNRDNVNDGELRFYSYQFSDPLGNQNSNRAEDYGAFPFDVTVTDPNGASYEGTGLAMILPELFMETMANWPELPITDCFHEDDADCADFNRGLEIDTLLEILARPHLTENQPPVVGDDFFAFTLGLSQPMNLLHNDEDLNDDTLVLGLPDATGFGIPLVATAQGAELQVPDHAGFDHFSYTVVEDFLSDQPNAAVPGDVYLAMSTGAAPNQCNNANLLAWVPGIHEDATETADNTTYSNLVAPECKLQFDGPEVWWGVRFPENVPDVGFAIDTLPGDLTNPVGDTILQVFVIDQPGLMGDMCNAEGEVMCFDNISGANLYSRFAGNARDYAGKALLLMVDSVSDERGQVRLNLRTTARNP